ncbi:MAG: hypothetical protein M5U14_13015 [Acidimicrobiia bacterium]|nr:hypothetical protein [Acidimicrobiia bacterium]
MSDLSSADFGETPTIEVTVYRHGEVIHRELVESEEAAAEVVERWTEEPGVECSVDDLSVHHEAGDILEPEPTALEDEYRPSAEPEV